MKEGNLVIDGDGNYGVVVCLLLVTPDGTVPWDYGSVAFVYFFNTQEDEIVYEDEITIIGEFDGPHILE